jgi:hypothetical protein
VLASLVTCCALAAAAPAAAAPGPSATEVHALAGAPAAKLGVPDEPCRHTACDTPDRLRRGAFARLLRIVWPLLRDWPA